MRNKNKNEPLGIYVLSLDIDGDVTRWQRVINSFRS